MEHNETCGNLQAIGTPLIHYGPLTDRVAVRRVERTEPPVAVLVCHGMGQQVRFETISAVAEAVLQEASEDHGIVAPVEVRLSRANDDFLARAEIHWMDQDNCRHEAHIYEAYWAPLTENKVTYRDTIKFLWSAAWNGLRYSKFLRASTFRRWMFDKPQVLPIGRATFVAIIGTALALLLSMLLVAFASVEVARWIKTLSTAQHPLWNAGLGEWVKFLLSLLPAGTGVLFNWTNSSPWDWLRAILWTVAVVQGFFLRYFIMEYVGDVAAYVEPYKDSKFDDLRHKIQKIGYNVGKVIYGFPSDDGGGKDGDANYADPRYTKVLIVGHSLGSVLAYDTLNAMINLDNVLGRSQRVVERTRALITFGSPLDKTAFLFRTQAKRPQDWIREELAAAVQPLIVNYNQYRPLTFQWINIWSPQDVISGELNYYDDPYLPGSDPQHVQNMIDPEAFTPFVAHVQYWNNKMLRQQLYQYIVA